MASSQPLRGHDAEEPVRDGAPLVPAADGQPRLRWLVAGGALCAVGAVAFVGQRVLTASADAHTVARSQAKEDISNVESKWWELPHADAKEEAVSLEEGPKKGDYQHHFDCKAGLKNWKHGWSEAKKKHCCEAEKVGCEEEAEFDCKAGLINWERGWSEAKKKWCCRNENLGCPEPDNKYGFRTMQCHGHENQREECTGLPSCDTCTPINCRFQEWEDWFRLGGCTGLCARHRSISQANNECGKPCEGPKIETIRNHSCYEDGCAAIEDKPTCTWGLWTDWSICAVPTDQSTRTRDFLATDMSAPCQGVSKETKPCAAEEPELPCIFSNWTAWTTCSKTCGGGTQAQTRRIIKEATVNGKPCSGVTRRTQSCNTAACHAVQDCVVSQWTPWDGCNADSPLQKFRSRKVVAEPTRGGKPCAEGLYETVGCGDAKDVGPEPCKFSDWSAWENCTATCGGGQTQRKRYLVMHGSNCARTSLHETKSCWAEPCPRQGPTDADCKLSEWSQWTPCSITCGTGVRTATRKVIRECSSEAGLACTEAALERAAPCQVKECREQDCEWYDWSKWSGCSCSCGGGSKRRKRSIKTRPVNGTSCPARPCEPFNMYEVSGCNEEPCTHCIDGKWGTWTQWSSCSDTCAPAFRSRHRAIARHASTCGKPVAGLEDEFALCAGLKKCEVDVDCEMSEWHEWSACSSSCNGIRERNRHITRTSEGEGKACTDTTKEVEPCHPGKNGGPPPMGCGDHEIVSQCVLSDWSGWSKCSRTCDSGQMSKSRHVLQPAVNAPPCEALLVITAACNTQPCDTNVKDCVMGNWSAWSGCDCSSTQMYRVRAVQSLPRHGGKPCKLSATKETRECPPEAAAAAACNPRMFCSWSEWSHFTPCSADCGPSQKLRERHLLSTPDEPEGGAHSVFIKGDPGMMCDGHQVDVQACKTESCHPVCTCTPESPKVDCKYSSWSEWNAPANQWGLCQRSRRVVQEAECGGALCDAQLVETKRCAPKSDKIDCTFSDWTRWTPCGRENNGVHQKQKYRQRIVNQTQENGGAPCKGELFQTEPCTCEIGECYNTADSDCKFSAWDGWSQCTETTCEGMQREFMTRARAIASQAKGAGADCDGPLLLVQRCPLPMHCMDDAHTGRMACEFGDWQEWGSCENMQRSRERQVIKEGKLGGMPCKGALSQTKSCEDAVDCKVSAWTPWDQCDKVCGGGQQERSRTVEVNPRSGGKVCPFSLQETQGCNLATCGQAVDCETSDWSQWTRCSSTCGTGQHQRTRIFQSLARAGGAGCNTTLHDVRPCEGLPSCGSVDCKWQDWSEWSACTCDCGGGQHTRDRRIAVMPEHGGKPCEANDLEQIEPCNTQSCDKGEICTDAEWADWEEWQPCSKSCEGGLTWRQRKAAREANHCGKPLEGKYREFSTCNVDTPCEPDIDCKFGDWSAWGACSRTCGGVMKRSRGIEVFPQRNGIYCQGPMKETAPCNAQSALPNLEAAEELDLVDWNSPKLYANFSTVGAKLRPEMGDETMSFVGVAPGVDMALTGSQSLKTSIRKSGPTHDAYLAQFIVPAAKEMHFTATFVNDRSHKPVRMDKAAFRFFDLDMWKDVSEELIVDKVCSFCTFVNGKANCDECMDKQHEEVFTIHAGHRVKVTELQKGGYSMTGGEVSSQLSNPVVPSQLTRDQQEASVIINAKHVSALFFRFKNTGKVERSILFAAKLCPSCESDAVMAPTSTAAYPVKAVATGCDEEPHQDCKLGSWSEWNDCSQTCNGGQHERHRQIVMEPRGDGKFCDSELSETKPCATQACPAACQPIDCLYAAWSKWSACLRGAGQAMRTRWITKEPECGGLACDMAATEETKPCVRYENDEHYYCMWSNWGEWGECSAKCGHATRDRKRELKVTAMRMVDGKEVLDKSQSGIISEVSKEGSGDLESSLEQLYRRQRSGEAKRVQELVLAFSCGCIMISLLLFAQRTCGRTRSARQQEVTHRYHEVALSARPLQAAGDDGDSMIE
eukprot:TRINITY_DN1260_c0_g2_i1.p1 TRINITY_DN1260_c0_g2~~TRINITY_DN1260_c0_g2_i1.p1  ORF type:complete len:1993 (+),score=486.90 TRINITY_DN1260_c0_g2_i1:90-6068(+)